MNFLDAETDDADFRAAARRVRGGAREPSRKKSRDDGGEKNSRGRKKMMQSIDEQWPLKLTLGDAQDLDFYGSLENPILSKQVWLQSK